MKYNLILGEAFETTKQLIKKKEKFKLIITSPPYNIGKKYEKNLNFEEYINFQKLIIQNLVQLLDENGSICWQVGNYIKNDEVYPLDIFFYNIFKEFGLKLRNRIIWHFGHGLHAQKKFSGRYETILWFTKSDSYIFNLDPIRVPQKYPGKRTKNGEYTCNPVGKNPSDVWEILQNDWVEGFWSIPNVKANHVEKTIHPCQFPIELVERCILALTNEGDKVLDPFVGSGTSIIAALKNNRIGYGIDKEEEYIKISNKRIEEYFNGNLKYREIKPVFDHKLSPLSRK
ncbi:site-specific DNA-methyltransferase [Fusobacterium sp.]|uniref:DNA-methyltransferase n=1 Tax=Fusobacterium sp. TaxID=68766 RepID=UPI000E93405A|nr:site-specific DNA-methyltransferase [Fusobacterium sp.]HBJ80198.1 site-specific DNA-methyltransferase [Fusobacterium sp.]